MIEKKVFPELASDGQLYAYSLKNTFWFDLGKPEDYIKGQHAYLQYYDQKDSKGEGNCLIDPTAIIGAGCKIGPNVVIGANCKIGTGCKLQNCAVFQNT